ncbi:transcription initiation factor TFIIE subunit alpha [Nematocida minor]|uniref:transcription initiation factor TFIIE subunit alpha n=1 Tax=Nematocida minor TaxID=1912983 RepID=UPI00221F0371|nr:transcription initiation factor TFIIE subunit alpha [Nematocida minor]KAI5191213.1 transcription initiation factor TFIIE subunit alpha [Nematocida minor]
MEDARKPMEELVQRVVRMFYEPCHVVIMDIMLRHLSLDEDDLADKMKLLPREFNRMAVRLRDDRLLSTETTSEMKDDGRQETRTRFFLDFRTIRDVIKYKIYTMTQRLERSLREKETVQGLGCSLCNVTYSVLDAQSFLSMDDFSFKCPECKNSLTETKETAGNDKDAVSNTFSRMMDAVSPVIAQLKEIDAVGIPEIVRGKAVAQQVLLPGHILYENMRTDEAAPKETVKAPIEEIEIAEEEKQKTEEAASGANLDSEEETVLVEGVAKRFSAVTEADKERMSEEEYERYFELFEKYNG